MFNIFVEAMPPRRGIWKGTAEPEGWIDCIERVLEVLVQVVQDAHNNNHDNAPQQPAMQMPGVEMMNHTTIQ